MSSREMAIRCRSGITEDSLYDIILPRQWLGLDDFLDYCLKSGIDDLSRLILSSNGSLTRLLRALTLSEVAFKVGRQTLTSIDEDTARFLDTAASGPAISRDVWMGCEKKQLVFATCLISISEMSSELYDEITRQVKPLGTLISKYNLRAVKEKFSFALVKSPQIAAQLGYNQDQSFWARFYKLSAEGGLLAKVFEVFSPELVTVPSNGVCMI